MRIGIVGGGVAGLVSALLLDRAHDVTLFEADDRLGGHANTVEVEVGGRPAAVDTGFVVYNEPNYPGFVGLLDHLGVASQASDMSFSVSDERSGIEWCGRTPSSLFAQRRNALDPRFLRMLRDVTRFNRAARTIVRHGGADPGTLAELVTSLGLGPEVLDWYLVPMGASIWSADPRTFAEVPALTFARFLDNHGLLRVAGHPTWRTVVGGGARYVDALARRLRGPIRTGCPVVEVVRRGGGVEVRTASGQSFELDHVVLAVHSDQALRMLAGPSERERSVLGALRYQPNVAVLHTDAGLLPRNRRAWASWNHHRPATEGGGVAVTYLMNRLQQEDWPVPVLVTLNRTDDIDPATVLAELRYQHPVLDGAAVAAQGRYAEINGCGGVSYAGAYWGHGFHEDGVQSAIRVARALGAEVPW